jgi:hypothetical protein
LTKEGRFGMVDLPIPVPSFFHWLSVFAVEIKMAESSKAI